MRKTDNIKSLNEDLNLVSSPVLVNIRSGQIEFIEGCVIHSSELFPFRILCFVNEHAH